MRLARNWVLCVAAAVCVAPFHAVAQTSWAEAAEAVMVQRDAYIDRADALDASPFLGTAMNELDVDAHTCAILGRMLGLSELIGHLEPAYPPLSGSDGRAMRVAALSMDNWLAVLEQLFPLDQTTREAVWDMRCAGQNDIPASARIAPTARDAFARYDPQVMTLTMFGEITPGYADTLIAALDTHPQTETVSLGGGGGSVVEAMEAGREIRRRGVETTLHAACDAACPLVFMGGTQRRVWSPWPPLRFTLLDLDGQSIPAPHPLYDQISAYVTEMDGDGPAYVAHMLAASPDSLNAPEYDELCQQNIVTWAQRLC